MIEVVLALGGGGVKGNAHIGVMRTLDRAKIRIRAIAGTSAGGFWGAFYAAGFHPDEIEARIMALDPSTSYQRQPGDGPAMLGLAGVRRALEEALGDRTFDSLHIPLAVTAVDLNSGEQVIIRSGGLIDGLLATIAVPGVFPPRPWRGRMLVDGGVTDPLPVGLAREMAGDLPVVAVALSPGLSEWANGAPPRLLGALPPLANYISRLRIAQALDIFMRSVDIGGAMLTDLRLQLHPPDVIIRPDVQHIGLLDTVNVPEVARLGELAALAALPEIRRAAGWPQRLKRRLGVKPAQVIHRESRHDT
jgi:NTE family protein